LADRQSASALSVHLYLFTQSVHIVPRLPPSATFQYRLMANIVMCALQMFVISCWCICCRARELTDVSAVRKMPNLTVACLRCEYFFIHYYALDPQNKTCSEQNEEKVFHQEEILSKW